MTPDQIKQVIQEGQWVSITTELRPSTNKSATGEIQPFYCSRVFTYSPGDRFACTVMNYADANGKVPLVKIGNYSGAQATGKPYGYAGQAKQPVCDKHSILSEPPLK